MAEPAKQLLPKNTQPLREGDTAYLRVRVRKLYRGENTATVDVHRGYAGVIQGFRFDIVSIDALIPLDVAAAGVVTKP